MGLYLEKEDIREGLAFDNKELSNEDLFELEETKAYVEIEEVQEFGDTLIKITSSNIRMILTKANELCDFIREVDPISDRHFNVHNDIRKPMNCYQNEMDERKTFKQTDIGNFFKKL